MGEDERTKLLSEEAEKMLPDGDRIHTFMQAGPVLLGADWDKKKIIESFDKFGVELSGPMATKMKHGLVFFDEEKRPVFVATKESVE